MHGNPVVVCKKGERSDFIENWKMVRGSQYYAVSDLGNVKCVGGVIMRKDGKPYTLTPRKLTPKVSNCNYMMIHLNIDVNRHALIHRLVLEAFNPVENMENLQVNHIDGNKQNNKLENLEWATREENMQHALRMGLWVPTYARGKDNPHLKLLDEDVAEIRKLLATGQYKQYEIAEMYGVRDSVISTIKHNKRRFKQ